MSQSLCKERTALVFKSELETRVSAAHKIKWRLGRRDSADTGIVGVVRVDNITEIAPDCGVYYADVAIVLVRNMDDPPNDPAKTRAQEQSEALQDVEKALNQIPHNGDDPDVGLNLHGWTIEDIGEASDDQDYADVISIRAGVSVMEKQFQSEVQAPV